MTYCQVGWRWFDISAILNLTDKDKCPGRVYIVAQWIYQEEKDENKNKNSVIKMKILIQEMGEVIE